MEITLTGRKLEMTDALKNHIDGKVNGIKKFLNAANDVHIVLSVEKHRHSAEITLNANGYVIHCKEETDDMYSTIDRVVEKLTKQLKKHKDKVLTLKGKRRHEEEKTSNFGSDLLPYEKESKISKDPKIIQSTNFDAKPMFLEEAGMHIRSAKKNFLVFRNASNDRINVLYIRNDGDLGLIDTE